MTWKVLLSPDAKAFLDKTDRQVADRLRKGLRKLKADNPFHFLEHFEGQDYYKFRIGDYRALVDVDFKRKILKIQVLDRRNIIYKRIASRGLNRRIPRKTLDGRSSRKRIS